MIMVSLSLIATGVVFSILDTVGTKNMIKACATVWSLLNPLLDDREHVLVDLQMWIPHCWMMKCTQNIVHYLWKGDIRMLHGINDTGCDILKNDRGNFSSRFIEDVGEMIFAQHRMGRI